MSFTSMIAKESNNLLAYIATDPQRVVVLLPILAIAGAAYGVSKLVEKINDKG